MLTNRKHNIYKNIFLFYDECHNGKKNVQWMIEHEWVCSVPISYDKNNFLLVHFVEDILRDSAFITELLELGFYFTCERVVNIC
jgi:hypothetical protein